MDKAPPSRMPQFTQDWLQRYRDQGVDATAGRYSYGRPEVQFRPAETHLTKLTIGAYCSIARGCTINLGSFGQHPMELVSTYPLAMIFGQPSMMNLPNSGASAAGVDIGSDVWIGEGSILFSGVTVGHGAVIGTRSLVTRDIPPFAIAAGTPARVTRFRFPEDVIERLLALAWWAWDDQQIREKLTAFFTVDIHSALDQLEEVIGDQTTL